MAVIRRNGKANPNLLLEQASGMLSGIVIKRYKDKIVFASPPTRKKRKPTPAQADRRHKMKRAVRFARQVIADPERKASWKKYAKGYSSVNQAIVSWFMKNNGDPSLMPPDVAKVWQRKRAELLKTT